MVAVVGFNISCWSVARWEAQRNMVELSVGCGHLSAGFAFGEKTSHQAQPAPRLPSSQCWNSPASSPVLVCCCELLTLNNPLDVWVVLCSKLSDNDSFCPLPHAVFPVWCLHLMDLDQCRWIHTIQYTSGVANVLWPIGSLQYDASQLYWMCLHMIS